LRDWEMERWSDRETKEIELGYYENANLKFDLE
jgi:hypothetical protein